MNANKPSYEDLERQVTILHDQLVNLSLLLSETYNGPKVVVEGLINSETTLFIETDLQGKIRFFNRAAELLTEYSKNEVKNEFILDLFEPESSKTFVIDDKSVEFPDKLECKTVTKSGSECYFTLHRCEASENKNVVSRYFVGFDVTEIKKKETELVLESKAASAKKALNIELVNTVLHKIKTPVDTITGLSNLLNNTELDIAEKNNLAEVISNCSSELLGTVSELLNYNSFESEKEVVHIEKVSLNAILDELKGKFGGQVVFNGLNFRVRKGLSDKEAEVLTDAPKITQVLTNLLHNSIKYTEKGFIEIGYQLVKDEIEFYVKDSGVGLEKEFKDKLVNSQFKLERTSGEGSGAGLGLSNSKRLVDLLGGVFEVESTPGVGTAFYFRVPYILSPSEFKTEKARAKETTTVLIAEDEEISYLLLKTLLEKGNVNIIRAKNGEEAYEIYKNNPNINLILMDLRMPQVDGYTAAQLIKNEAPEIPIIAQSAYFKEDEEGHFGKTFDNFLSKPVNKANLKKAVNKYIDVTFLN
ncbi:MAG TPA: ATP-binding protein [Flavobacterium sp.]|uniref:hybrid sensor histidine kinase/response regulator n=1 Tax=Flavobacterium sp. TaxID=239 RepID=UPI002B694462|nr:ATP-binding protein [Flavobacterium sp.]HSD14709.1 ATP-binding protein [Flavobacterium sp.]